MNRPLTLLAILISPLLLAQQKIQEFEVTLPDSYARYNIETLGYDQDGQKVLLYGINWKNARLKTEESRSEDKKGIQLVRASDILGQAATAPFVTIASVDQNELLVVTEQPVLLSSVFDQLDPGIKYTLEDAITGKPLADSEASESWDELKLVYPRAFPAGKDYTEVRMFPGAAGFSGVQVEKRTVQYTQDKFTGKWIAGEPLSDRISFDYGTSYKVFPDADYVEDSKRSMVMIPVKVASGDRFSPYMHKMIYTVDDQGTVKGMVEVRLDQPKDLALATGFGNPGDTAASFANGALLIYGRAVLPGKRNDPDFSRYYQVLLDGEGREVHQGWFNMGEEKNRFDGYVGFASEEKRFVFGRIIGGENTGHVTLEFDQSGFEKVNLFDFQSMQAMLKGDAEESLRLFASRDFMPMGVTPLPGGKTIISGQCYEKETETLPPRPNESFGQKVEHTFYLSRIFLVFDENGQLTHYYSRKRPRSEKRGELMPRYQSGNMAVFYDPTFSEAFVLDLSADQIFKIGDVDILHVDKENTMVVLDREAVADKVILRGKVFALK